TRTREYGSATVATSQKHSILYLALYTDHYTNLCNLSACSFFWSRRNIAIQYRISHRLALFILLHEGRNWSYPVLDFGKHPPDHRFSDLFNGIYCGFAGRQQKAFGRRAFHAER